MVFGLIALLTLFRSTFLVTASTGILCSLILKYEAALSNAAWADTGMILMSYNKSKLVHRWLKANRRESMREKREERTYISGSVMPLVSRAHSRWVLTAIMMDSVPPDVVVPAPVGLLYLMAGRVHEMSQVLDVRGKISMLTIADT